MRYTVFVREVHQIAFEVEAGTFEEAVNKVEDMDIPNDIDLDYVCTLDKDEWPGVDDKSNWIEPLKRHI